MSTINLAALQNVHSVQDALNLGMRPTDVMRLSPASQFVTGKAALVFVSPHVVDASKDMATFGDAGVSPHPGALAAVWIKAAADSTTVVVDFVCQAFRDPSPEQAYVAPSTFTLTGGAQTETVPSNGHEQHVSFVGIFPSQWRPVNLSCSGSWKLVRCEITVLGKQ